MKRMSSPFEGLFGNSGELRILEFLLPLKNMEFNIKELAFEANISRSIADRVAKKFVKWGLLKISNRRGNIKYYKIDDQSRFVSLFEDLNNVIIEQMLGDDMLHQIADYWKDQIPAKQPAIVTKHVQAGKLLSDSYSSQIESWWSPQYNNVPSPIPAQRELCAMCVSPVTIPRTILGAYPDVA
jgi:predicted transcriptional regulator